MIKIPKIKKKKTKIKVVKYQADSVANWQHSYILETNW